MPVPSNRRLLALFVALAPGCFWFEKLRGSGPNAIDAAITCKAVPVGTSDFRHDGEGTRSSPYILCTADQLVRLSTAADAWRSSFALGVDLDMASTPLGSIGQNEETPFTGTFDGLDHTVSHVSINNNNAKNATGFFGFVSSSAADIRRLHISDAVVVGQDDTGILVGSLADGVVLASSAAGSVQGKSRVGGLIGRVNTGGLVSTSWASATVKSVSDDPNAGSAGGLIGEAGGAWIENVYASGEVSGRHEVGGLIGSVSASKILNAYASGAVRADTGQAGGLVGHCRSMHLEQSVATSDVHTASGPIDRISGVSDFCSVETSYFVREAACSDDAGGSCVGDDATPIPRASSYDVASLFPVKRPKPQWDTKTTWVLQDGAMPTLTPKLFDYAAWGDCSKHTSEATPAGEGTPESPYLICTPAQFVVLASNTSLLDGTVFRLMSDLDMSIYANARTIGFPIGGDEGRSAEIYFDGNGRSITNFTYSATDDADFGGMFGKTFGAIKRLAVLHATVTSNARSVGIISGILRGAMHDSYTDAASSVAATNTRDFGQVGGIVGLLDDGRLRRCHSEATVVSTGNLLASGWHVHQPATRAGTANMHRRSSRVVHR